MAITSNNIVTYIEEVLGEEDKTGDVTISDFNDELVEFHIGDRTLLFDGQELIIAINNALQAGK